MSRTALHPEELVRQVLVGCALLTVACGSQTQSRLAPTQPAKPATASASASSEPEDKKPSFGPALAKRDHTTYRLLGKTILDPYQWLETHDDPDTRKWASHYDAFTRKYIAEAAPFHDRLKARLTELSYLDYVGPPHREGRRYFWRQRHKDKEKTVWYWREGKTGSPRILLDPNTMSRDGSVALHGVYPSPNGKWVAYRLSQNNADEATLHVMDVGSGKRSEVDTIDGAKYAYPEWNPRSTGFFYTRIPTSDDVPETDLPAHAQIFYHAVGKAPSDDQLIVPKTGDAKIFIHPSLSRDGRFLFIVRNHGWTSTDIDLQDNRGDKKMRPLVRGLDARFFPFAHRGRVYLHTNYQASNWRVVRVDPSRPDPENWTTVIAEDTSAVLKDVRVIGGQLGLTYLEKASTRLKLARLDGRKVRDVTLPGIGTSGGFIGHPNDDTAYFEFTSYTQPALAFELSVKSGRAKQHSAVKLPLDASKLHTEQLTYRSKDGTEVTMFVTRRRDAEGGAKPLLLYGYGGFNISLTPRFSAADMTWLEAGGTLAIPNLRGGGEYGEKWHRAGMLENKQNVFDDFIAAAEFLIAKGFTSKQQLAIQGRSNGGLLVGAAMTQRPDLFKAVVCGVPLLDMVRYHRFGAGKTWIQEYGSADDPAQAKYLLAYSPYHRLEKGVRYPALLMLSADSDDRVDPMHARKFVARLQYAASGSNPILLRVEDKAGHGGGDMVKKYVELRADEYAFLMTQLGLTPAKP